MKLSEIKDKLSEDKFMKDFAIFIDKLGDAHLVGIRIVPNAIIGLKSFNEQNQETGYMNLFFNPNQRLFLDTIYCYDQYRSRNIASNLSQIADFVLQDYPNHIIRGVYDPMQLSTDRKNNIQREKTELIRRADNFYASTGYTKIHYEDYKLNPSKYPDINERDDFQLGEEIAEIIIMKKTGLQLNKKFERINGVLINEESLKKIKQQISQDSELEI